RGQRRVLASNAGDAEQTGQDRAEDVTSRASKRAEGNNLQTTRQPVATRPAALDHAHDEQAQARNADRDVLRQADLDGQEGNDWQERSQPEGAAHDERPAQWAALITARQPELLFDHRLEQHRLARGDLGGYAQGDLALEALLLEHERDLGLSLLGPILDLLR